MKILITGYDGMLGKDIYDYFDNIGCFVIPTNREIMDITDKKQTEVVISKAKPDLIIHCAAYTNVEKAEEEKEKVKKINVEGAKNVALAAHKNNSTLIYFSTDYVFDGNKDSAYVPDDMPSPINFYGLTKYQGELEVIKNCKKYFIVRTSWLYGANGQNFISKLLSKAKIEDEIKVVNDQIGKPTWTYTLIQALVQILNKPYGIYHISSEGETSWYEFATEVFKILKIKTKLIPIKTQELEQKAKRPKYSALKNSVSCEHWKAQLNKYISTIK